MISAKSGQVLPDLKKYFFANGKPIWGKSANNYDVAQLQVTISP